MISIPAIFERYRALHPAEHDRLDRLATWIAEPWSPESLIARNNFTGHVTASGFVFNPERSAILLIHHAGLNMYVQPGGHVEPNDASLLESARREIHEETGITHAQHLSTFHDPLIPFDIDTHYIPPNARKGEPEHWHHDFRYAFACTGDPEIQMAEQEVTDARWVLVKDLHRYPTFEHVAKKIVNLTNMASES